VCRTALAATGNKQDAMDIQQVHRCVRLRDPLNNDECRCA
jgi:hypothetical protein